jgi:PhoD-like phosphatase
MPEPAVLLGPLLRHVDATSAAIWMELDRRCAVTVSAAGREYTEPTFTVHGHHYALVDVTDLEPGRSSPYTVTVDGTQVWPTPDSPYPPSRIRPIADTGRLRIAFGSCRTTAPHDAETNRTNGPDMLRVLGRRMAATEEAEWPTLLLLLGDQVYADETTAEMHDYIAARRDLDQPPGTELLNYDEYAYLYRLAWTDPDCRWLLSTLPTAMIFDDHDIRDDWNTSETWRAQMRRTSWWQHRIVSGLASYWVYQHIGNLSRTDREADPVWRDVIANGRDGDAGDVLDALATRADADPAAYRWSYHRDIGPTRIVMVDTRAARVLDEPNRRMLDPTERQWFDDLVGGEVDHLLIGSSLPFLLEPGLHHLEAWNEAVVGGAWGSRAARSGERIRQAIDLEHWAAFQHSFQEVARRVVDVATGGRGTPPATVLFLSGDVHHSYLADVDVGAANGSRVLQAVCSPIRNPMPRWARWGSAVSIHGLAGPMGWLASRTARVPRPPIRWTISEGPWFENAIAFLDIDGRRADLRWATADIDGSGEPSIRTLQEIRVT